MICLDNWFSLSSVGVRMKASLGEMTITPLWLSEALSKKALRDIVMGLMAPLSSSY